jgi:methyltransferase
MMPIAALSVVVAFMLLELAISRRNERILLAQGAVRVPDPVYRLMQIGYPVVFVAMALEGWTHMGGLAPMGAAVFAAAKLFKFWAIATLGYRWTYTVLVLPGAPLVTSGPYVFMRHPNYAGVIGEIVGMALMMTAVITGLASLVFFGVLLLIRIRAEERALHLY